MRHLAFVLLAAAAACVPLEKADLTVGGQFRSAKAAATRSEDGTWLISLSLPDPTGSMAWHVVPEDAADPVVVRGPGGWTAAWRISRSRWLDSRPLKIQVQNQNGLDVPMYLGHPHTEERMHTAVRVILEILRPLPRF